MVERNLAKVEVASSSLVSRSKSLLKARWQSGHAAACKAVYAGSIPTLASRPFADVAKLVYAADFDRSARGDTRGAEPPKFGERYRFRSRPIPSQAPQGEGVETRRVAPTARMEAKAKG